jgi:uncharacterized protein involved in response to NO
MTMQTNIAVPGRRSTRLPLAHAFFFPAAAAYAVLLVPWWILTLSGVVPGPPAFEWPMGHAHELLFGFGAAVVAGYLLGPQPTSVSLLLLVAWSVARVSYLAWPGSLAAALTAALFAGGMAVRVLPRFLYAAKKWRNRTVAPVVALFAAFAAVAASIGDGQFVWLRLVLFEGLLVISILMFFMGGRIIAPAIAGHLTRQGLAVDVRVQPVLEGAVLLLLFAALLLAAVPIPMADLMAAIVLIAAGVLTGVRLLRWRVWRLRNRPDLWALVLAYAWVPIGLCMIGASLSMTSVPFSAGAHAIGIGALGSLTLTVMARTRLLYRYRDANAAPAIHLATVMISVAALLRIWGAMDPRAMSVAVLGLVAVLWAGAFLILLVVLARTLRPARGFST